MNWHDFEQQHVWHPYAPMPPTQPNYPVSHAEGVCLHLEDGRVLIDGMSSWWCAIHGYNHPVLNDAIQTQLQSMAHVMFGGLTHQPAATLAATLIEITPDALQYVFFCDSGSVAVEVAIKMALQYWQAQGRLKKQQLLTIRHGYHGDTFGAMSVCDPIGGMHHLFSPMMPSHLFADAPTAQTDQDWDDGQMASFRDLIAQHSDEIAAVILEPIVQGAGGMRIYAPEFLRQVRALCDAHDVLLIVDEIATGFGRTGKMFACEHADISPDIMCLGKALTGGYMTLAAVLTSERVRASIHTDHHLLMHGPTFMANPLACAVAHASTRLLLDGAWQKKMAHIAKRLEAGLSLCRDVPGVADVRVIGAIGVVEMKQTLDMAVIQTALVNEGVWIRPFGKLIYLMPPYIIEDDDLDTLTAAIFRVTTQLIP